MDFDALWDDARTELSEAYRDLVGFVIAAADEYFAKQAEAKVLDGRLKELKEQLVTAMDGAPTAYAGARVLSLASFPAVPAIPERKIDRTMIGQTIPGKSGKSGYVQLRVQ